MRNIRLRLAYDGTAYVGWQVQPNGVSVQEVVERAIRRLTGESVRLMAAGRTDSGVHALGQVANFVTASTIPCDGLRAALQALLPEDVVILDAAQVTAAFHATYSAASKRYRYLIHNAPRPDPFLRRYAWHHRGGLDVGAMQDAARFLLGTHDFRCFESQFPNKATSVRTVMEARVSRRSSWSPWTTARLSSLAEAVTGADQERLATAGGAAAPTVQVPAHGPRGDAAAAPLPEPLIVFEVTADGFLYNMVRTIVGTLVRIGRGKWSPADMRRIIDSQDRAAAGETAPPHGLYLVEVTYRSGHGERPEHRPGQG